MKKTLLLIAFIATGLIANAQGTTTAAKQDAKPVAKQQGPDASARAASNTDKMTTVLALTADQKPKVQAINLEKAKAMDANNQKNGKDAKALEAEKQKVIAKWETDLKAVLTADQFTKLKKVEADNAAKRTQQGK